MGYHLAKEMIMRYPDATLITRKNNLAQLQNDPFFHDLDLIGIDVPAWLSFFKKGSRGIILYYYLWQYFVGRAFQKLDRIKKYDVVHQINFHADWAPHFLHSNTARILWGPLMHHPAIPLSWFRQIGLRCYVQDKIKNSIKNILWLNPYLKCAMKRSHHIFFGNPFIPQPYTHHQAKICVTPLAGSHWTPRQKSCADDPHFNLLFIGRLTALKGPHLTLDGFEKFLAALPDIERQYVHLTIVGDGELDAWVTQKTKAICSMYAGCVTRLGWQSRKNLSDVYYNMDYLVYPSLESQGLVVGEALSQGCPVITLAGTGPAFITQQPDLTITCNPQDYSVCVDALANKLSDLYHTRQTDSEQIHHLRQMAFKRAEDLRWNVIAETLLAHYDPSHD